VEKVTVQFCSDTACLIGKTNADGYASFDQPAGAVYTVHILKTPSGYEKNEAEYETLREYCDVEVVVSKAADIEGVYYAIRMIGHLMGKDAEAEAVVTDMQTTFADIKAKSKDEGKTVYFEVSPLQWGLWTAGKGTFMDELAGICGLTNAFADVNDWAGIREEQVIARDPDYIVTITMYYGEGPTPVEEIMGREGWQDLKAVKEKQVFNASDSNALSRPGPRLKDAAVELYDFIYGEAAEVEPAA
jgi:iron complex transport system substrate-binding protein